MSCYEGRTVTKRLTADGAVKDAPGVVKRIRIEARGGGGGFVKLYNAASATGTPIVHRVTADDYAIANENLDAFFSTAIYCDLSNAYVEIEYL